MTLSFALTRFSGSTLEPSSEPIMLYESKYYEKGAGRALHIKIIPTRPTLPLKRNAKPPHIIIPTPKFDEVAYLDYEESSPLTCEEGVDSPMLWDSLSTISNTSL